MPRNKTFRKMKIKKRKQSGGTSKVEKTREEQITELFAQAESDTTTFSYESAVANCNKILEIDPEHFPTVELLASVYMDMQDVHQAKSLYLRCVELSPDEGHEKFLSLGQLSVGKEALSYYEKGISIVEAKLERLKNSEEQSASGMNPGVPSLNRVLSDALCSVAELYMTDLCDEDEAERSCETALRKSISVDDSNPEAYQCLASLRLIQGNDEEARSNMQKSISFWLPLALDEEFGPENEHRIPEYDSRIKAGQLLIELQMYEEASQVLERLLEEDDEVFMAWYLLGWANYLHGDIYKGTAHYYLKKAKEVGDKFGCESEDLMQHVLELLEELGPFAQNEDDNEGTNGEQLEISSSDSENENDGMDVN